MCGGRHALLTVIVYDVSDDRMRTRLHKLLRQYGVPVQESAFEARLTGNERRRLLDLAAVLINPITDRFVIYTVAKPQEHNIECLGVPRPEIRDDPFVLV